MATPHIAPPHVSDMSPGGARHQGTTNGVPSTRSRCPVMLAVSAAVALLASCCQAAAAQLQVDGGLEKVNNDSEGGVVFDMAADWGDGDRLQLKEGMKVPLNLTATYEYQSADPHLQKADTFGDTVFIELVPRDDRVLQVWPKRVNSTAVCERSVKANAAVCKAKAQFILEATFLGETCIVPSITRASNNEIISDRMRNFVQYCVTVIRDGKIKQYVFIGTLTLLIVLANVGLGCQLDLAVVWSVIRRPIGPAIGLLCQFVVMPLVGWALASMLLLPYNERALALGIFVAACAPGGGASNVWTVLLEGDLDLSVTMTFVSTVSALGLMPLWIFAVGNGLLSSGTDTLIKVPHRNIVTGLAVLVVPIFVGVLIRKMRPSMAECSKKVLRPFFLLIILFICTFGVWANLYMFRVMSIRVLAAGALLPWIGYTVGALVALAWGQDRRAVTAISIETGVQNSGVAIVLLQATFGQPAGDLAAVAPVAVSMATPFPLLLCLLCRLAKWCCYAEIEECGGANKQDDDEKKNGHIVLCDVDQLEPMITGDTKQLSGICDDSNHFDRSNA